MKNRVFRKLTAGTERAALVVLGVCGLAVAAPLSLRAQAAPGDTNSPTGQVVTAYLDYREVNYSPINQGLTVTTRSTAFKKEPAFSGSKVIRGTLQLGGGTNNGMAVVWDPDARKLYLDLNRNLDLTDDPAGVFSCGKGSSRNYQTFTNVRLPVKALAGRGEALVDLNLYNYADNSKLNCSAAVRSFWQGKVTLHGEEWQVGLLPNQFDQRQSLESGNLLLRAWSERNKSFSLHTGFPEAIAFSRKVFAGNHAYRLQCTNEVQGEVAKVRMEFVEQHPKLGTLTITGDFVQRVTLEGGPYGVILDAPAAMANVPAGQYTSAKVGLKKGETEAYPAAQSQHTRRRLAVSENAPAVLVAGGPLTNSVTVYARGKYLTLNYQLIGAGGPYQLVNQDRSHPPEFTVFQGDKKLAAGRFQFG